MADQQLCLETDLIRQAQNGNSAAYGELYTRHLTAIRHYIQKRVGESCDAEDLTQTVFVKAWQALRDYQPAGAPFRAWLYRIAHNAIVDHYRVQRHSLFWDELTWLVDPQGTPEMHIVETERQETVRRAVAGLRSSYQAVLDRRFLQELDYSETAAELGQQINHVRVVQHRALEALRRVLVQENVLWLATMVTIMTLLLGGKIVVAAEQALPGDRLYPMRTWVEEARLSLADEATAVTLHTRFATQRLTGLNTLYQQGRSADLQTAIVAAAAHIRAASDQFGDIQQTARTAMTPQFAAALQSQAATLHDFALTAPQTAPALQPVFVALTAAQAKVQPEDTGAAVPLPTATPGAPATRVLLPTPVSTVAVGVPTVQQPSTASSILPMPPLLATPAASVPLQTAAEAGHEAEQDVTADEEQPAPPAIVPTNPAPPSAEARPQPAPSDHHTADPSGPGVQSADATAVTSTENNDQPAATLPAPSAPADNHADGHPQPDRSPATQPTSSTNNAQPQPDNKELRGRSHDNGPRR